MSRGRAITTLFLGICFGVTGASAQPGPPTIGGFRVLPAGTPIRGAAGAPGSSDSLVFVTMPGERHTFTLRSASAKPVELLLIDAAGNIVLSKSGLREVTLEAVTSWAGTYSIAVVRADPATPYTLQRTTVPTTIERLMAALAVGYTVTQPNGVTVKKCWLSPGQKVRTTVPRAVTEEEVLPGALFKRWTSGAQAGRTLTTTYTMTADKVEVLERGPYGERQATLDVVPEQLEQASDDKFTGYTC